MKIFFLSYSLLLSVIVSAQTSTVLFKDSTVTSYKLMSYSIDENTNSKKTVLTSRKGNSQTLDLSDVHSLRFYSTTTDSLNFSLTFYTSSDESKSKVYSIKENQSGYVIETFKMPVLNKNDLPFDYKTINAIKIEALKSSDFLIDELSFQYSEDKIIITGPESMTPLLKEKKRNYRKEKAKENNSDYIKRQKEYESR